MKFKIKKMKTFEKVELNKIRRQLKKNGMRLSKSRNAVSIDNLGGYQIIDNDTNVVIDGLRNDLNLDDVKNLVEHLKNLADLERRYEKERGAEYVNYLKKM